VSGRGPGRVAGLLLLLAAAGRWLRRRRGGGGAGPAAARARPDGLRAEPRAGGGRAAVAFAVSALGSIGFMVAFVTTDGPQVIGLAAAVALGGLGAGLVLWSKRVMPAAPVVEERTDLDDARGRAETLSELAAVPRRRFLGSLLGAAGGLFGLAALFPLTSMGPRPRGQREATAWRPGTRLVRSDGRLVRAEDLQPGEFLTVFPEGAEGAADAQTVLIRLRPGVLRPAPAREDWSPEDHVAYSQLCTHAACTVGLYQEESQRLFCPCHQSAFDVLEQARPVQGPAPRPLPQLPLEVDEDGFLRAAGDFSAPVGPAWSGLA
jgi:ubiquinol-cytochrome c reductase iron-sulfur subunit